MGTEWDGRYPGLLSSVSLCVSRVTPCIEGFHEYGKLEDIPTFHASGIFRELVVGITARREAFRWFQRGSIFAQRPPWEGSSVQTKMES